MSLDVYLHQPACAHCGQRASGGYSARIKRSEVEELKVRVAKLEAAVDRMRVTGHPGRGVTR